MLGVDRYANVIWHDSAPPARAHDRDQDISRSYRVAPKLLVLLGRDEPWLTFFECVGNGVVDSENTYPFVNEFAMQQLASKWSGSDCALLVPADIVNRHHFPAGFHGVAEHVEEGGLEEGVELGEGLATLGPQGVRRIQNPRNPLLLGEGREGDLEVLQMLVLQVVDVRAGRQMGYDVAVSWGPEVVAK